MRWAMLTKALTLALVVPSVLYAQEKVPRTFGLKVKETRAPVGCLPAGQGSASLEPEVGSAGFCGKCTGEDHCEGRGCDPATGRCSEWASVGQTDESVWPRFHLLTTSITVPLFDEEDANWRPSAALGYYFQAAFCSTEPQALSDGGWLTRYLPSWYWHLGGSAALAGNTQDVLAELGLTYYWPAGPLAVTTVSGGVLGQRQGTAVHDFENKTANFTRVGPGVRVGFLYNIFIRAGYVFPVEGDLTDHAALLLSVEFMRDLADDVVPDKYRKYLPDVVR